MIIANFEKTLFSKNLDTLSKKGLDSLKLLKDGKLDMTGFVDLPINYDKEELLRLKEVTKEIKEKAEILVSIGIGGSYLGAKAGIDFLSDYFKKNEKGVEVLFVGNGLSEKYLSEALSYVKEKDFYINVISKSGGTLEPSIAFSKFKELAIKKYGKEEARKRIIATTDKKKGILKEEADKELYRTFVVPDDIGGRYSVMTSVGLFSLAASGYDIDKIMLGAKKAREKYLVEDVEKNDALKYAIIRNLYYNNGKDIEVFSTLSPNMRYISEWLKQLFGESECKENKGIFPASLTMTADLHSMGQLMQQGKRNIFETFIMINDDYDKERVDYNEKYKVNDINDIALRATEKAHFDGEVPVIEFRLKKQDEETLGFLFYFFEISCAISGLILGVNPFNQPGVEEYKKNIKELLK